MEGNGTVCIEKDQTIVKNVEEPLFVNMVKLRFDVRSVEDPRFADMVN